MFLILKCGYLAPMTDHKEIYRRRDYIGWVEIAPPFAALSSSPHSDPLISIVYHFAKCFIFELKRPRLSFYFRLKAGGNVQEKQLSFCGVKLKIDQAIVLTFCFSVFKKTPEGSHCLVRS